MDFRSQGRTGHRPRRRHRRPARPRPRRRARRGQARRTADHLPGRLRGGAGAAADGGAEAVAEAARKAAASPLRWADEDRRRTPKPDAGRRCRVRQAPTAGATRRHRLATPPPGTRPDRPEAGATRSPRTPDVERGASPCVNGDAATGTATPRGDAHGARTAVGRRRPPRDSRAHAAPPSPPATPTPPRPPAPQPAPPRRHPLARRPAPPPSGPRRGRARRARVSVPLGPRPRPRPGRAARALTDLPSFDTSAMDGWAVAGPGPWAVRDERDPRRARGARTPLTDGEAVRIATGARIPAGRHRRAPQRARPHRRQGAAARDPRGRSPGRTSGRAARSAAPATSSCPPAPW